MFSCNPDSDTNWRRKGSANVRTSKVSANVRKLEINFRSFTRYDIIKYFMRVYLPLQIGKL